MPAATQQANQKQCQKTDKTFASTAQAKAYVEQNSLCEGLDGKALQAGTSHNFGTNFSVPFEIQYLSKDGQLEYAHETSWGTTTRMIGAIIMTHGDERGLRLPPRVAPIQVVILPNAQHKEGVLEKAKALADEHVAQILGYVRASRIEHALLINFGAPKFEIKKYALSQPHRGGGGAASLLGTLLCVFASLAPFRG